MELDLIINPLFQIFKHDDAGIISEEIEDPSKFSLLYNYIFDNSNKKVAVNIINILKEIIKRQRSIAAFFPKYNNKSIYIFLYEIYLKEITNTQLRKALIEFISEINNNVQISKDEYDFIFQKFSKLYQKDKTFLESIKKLNYTFNDYFISLFELLNETFPKNLKDKNYPSNYFACFGKNSFILNFNKNNLSFGNCLSFNLNFKISKSKLIEKNSDTLNKCILIKINFVDNKKNIILELKYPNNLILLDGKKIIKSKVLQLGEWMNLLVTFVEKNGNISLYICLNDENLKNPYQLTNIKLKKEDKINSINFFDNFYGEVTSIVIISQKQNDSFNILAKNIKIFTEMKKGLWNNRTVFDFIKNVKNIAYSDKKRDKGGGGGNMSDDLVGVFTPINCDLSNPNIVEDCLGNNQLEINGNIRVNKYFPFQKNIHQICSINNFLPIVEMFIIHQREVLTHNNFLEYFKLIAKIVSEINNLLMMNKNNFFKILALYLEKIPNEYFNENILNEFENIGNNILSQNIKGFNSDFFTEILLNEKIISKYSVDMRSIFWNKFLQLYLMNKENMRNIIDIKNICNILLHYDSLAQSEMCCEFHLNMYKREFIGNMKVLKPNLDYQLISLKMIISEHSLTQNIESISPLIELLILDISPCLAKLIIGILINMLNAKNKDEIWIKSMALEITNNKYITILINLFDRSLPDIRYEILFLISLIYTSLLKLNNLDKFLLFIKMLKTCLLPKININDKVNENIQNLKKNLSPNQEKSKNNESNIKKENHKQNENVVKNEKTEIVSTKKNINNNINNKNNETEIINQPPQTKNNNEKKVSAKPNSILSLAEKFESKNKKSQTISIKPNPMKIDEGKFKIFEQNNKNQSQPIKTQPNNQVKKTKNDTKKTGNNIINNNPNIN